MDRSGYVAVRLEANRFFAREKHSSFGRHIHPSSFKGSIPVKNKAVSPGQRALASIKEAFRDLLIKFWKERLG